MTSGRRPSSGEVVDDLASRGALAGDDQGVIIRRDQNRAALPCDVAGDGFAIVAGAVVQHDFGAERRGAFALGARCIARHHDHAAHAEEPRRGGDPLRMIAGRERNDAAATLVERDRGELVVGAAELERSGALQGLGFEKSAAAGQGVERGRGQERRVQRHASQPASSVVDIGGGRQRNRGVHGADGSAAIVSQARALLEVF